MTSYSILFLIFVLFATTVDSRNLQEKADEGEEEESRGHHLWHKIADKIKEKTADKYNIDNRHFNSDATLLFPDVAFQSVNNTNTWQLMVHGWRYQNNDRKSWLGFSASVWIERLAHNLIDQNDILYLNGSINRDRLKPFFVTDQFDELITIKIGDKSHLLHTDKYGEFYEQIEVTNDDIQKLKQQQQRGGGNTITYEAMSDDEAKLTGIVRLIEPSQGISVISDIDDTIKISEVLDKVRLLANTFIYPFKAVPGMSDLYKQWQAKNPTCTFHYLSGMPDQLYTLTQEFINQNTFPDGSFHMRHFGWAAGSLFDFLHSQSTFIHKIRYLRFFLSHTIRDYVLIGDSGEKDPEIYGTIAREYSTRIRAIFIRAIKGESFDDQRFIDAFQGVSQEKWLIFNDPKQVPLDLSRSPRVAAGSKTITHV